MKNDFIEKLHHLYEIEDQVLYRWKLTRSAGPKYCMLSGVRFESLSCCHGDITFSSAAGYLHYHYGRPSIVFADEGMVVGMSGNRTGCNFPGQFRREYEEVMATSNCGHYAVGPNSPMWLARKVLAIGHQAYYETFRLIQPEWYRSTKQPEALKPLFSADLVRAIGGKKGDSLARLEDLFHKNMDRFGSYEEDGYVIPFQLIVTGGKVMCACRGMSIKGGALHCMDGAQFRAETARLRWKLKTGEQRDEKCDLGRLVQK